MQTADAEVRIQSAQSAQPAETAASDDPIMSQASVSQQDPQLEMAQSAAKPAAYQPTRFAAEAAQEADISSGDAPSESGQFGNGQGLDAAEPSAPGAQGLSETPGLGRGAEQVDAQQHVVTQQSSDLDSRQAQGFEGRAGRLPDQLLGPGQGFAEQAPDGRGGFANDAAPGLSGVKQVMTALHLLPCITRHQTGVLVFNLLPCILQQDHSQDLTAVLYWLHRMS